MKLDWNKIVSNAVTVLVASVFVGAAVQLWNGVQTIDSRIDANLADIKATQKVLAPKVDEIERRLVEILAHLESEHAEGIHTFTLPNKGSLDLIDEQRMMEQRAIPNNRRR